MVCPVPKISDREAFEEGIRLNEFFSLGPTRCVGSGHNEGGVGVLHPAHLGLRRLLADLRRRFLAALGRARAEYHRRSGDRPAQRQAGAEGAGAAEDRDGWDVGHERGRPVYVTTAASRPPVIPGR